MLNKEIAFLGINESLLIYWEGFFLSSHIESLCILHTVTMIALEKNKNKTNIPCKNISRKLQTLFKIAGGCFPVHGHIYFQVTAQMQPFPRVPLHSPWSASAACQTGMMQKLDWSSTGSIAVGKAIQDCSSVQIGPNDGLTEKCNHWHFVIWSCAGAGPCVIAAIAEVIWQLSCSAAIYMDQMSWFIFFLRILLRPVGFYSHR